MGNLQAGAGSKGRSPEDSSFNLGLAPEGWIEVERDEGCRFACLAAPITDGVEFPYDNKPEHGAFLNRQSLSIHTYCWYPTKRDSLLPRPNSHSPQGTTSHPSSVSVLSGAQGSSASGIAGTRSSGSVGTGGRSFSSVSSGAGSGGGAVLSSLSSSSSPSFAPSPEPTLLEKAEAVASSRGIVILLHGYCGHSRLAWLHKSLPTDHRRRDPTVNGYRSSDPDGGKKEKGEKGKRLTERPECAACSAESSSSRKTGRAESGKTSGLADERSSTATQLPGGRRETSGAHVPGGSSTLPPTKGGSGAFGARVSTSGLMSVQSDGATCLRHHACAALPAYHVKYQGSWIEALNNAGFVVTAMDLQGHGLSEGWQKKRASVHRLDDFAVDVIQFLAVIRRRCQLLRAIYRQYVQQSVVDGDGGYSTDRRASVEEKSRDDDVDEPLPIFLMGLSLGGWVAARATQLLGDSKALSSLLQVCSPDAPLPPPLSLSECKKPASLLPGPTYSTISSSLSRACPPHSCLAGEQGAAKTLAPTALSPPSLSSSRVSGKELNGLGGGRSCRTGDATLLSSPYFGGVSGCVLLSPMLDLSFVKAASRYSLYRPLLGRMADWTPHVIVSKPMPNLQYPYLEEYIQRDKYTYKGGSRVRMVREMFEGADLILQSPQIGLMSEKTCGALLLIHNLLDEVCGVEGSLRLFHGAKSIRDKSFLAVNAYVGGTPTTQHLHASQRGERGGTRESVFLTTPAGALAAERNNVQVPQVEEEEAMRLRKRGEKRGGTGAQREDQGPPASGGEEDAGQGSSEKSLTEVKGVAGSEEEIQEKRSTATGAGDFVEETAHHAELQEKSPGEAARCGSKEDGQAEATAPANSSCTSEPRWRSPGEDVTCKKGERGRDSLLAGAPAEEGFHPEGHSGQRREDLAPWNVTETEVGEPHEHSSSSTENGKNHRTPDKEGKTHQEVRGGKVREVPFCTSSVSTSNRCDSDHDGQQGRAEAAPGQDGEGKADSAEQATRKGRSHDTNQSTAGTLADQVPKSAEDEQPSQAQSSLGVGSTSGSLHASSTSAERNEEQRNRARSLSKTTVVSPGSPYVASLPGPLPSMHTGVQPPGKADSLTTASTKLSVRFDHGKSREYADATTSVLEEGSPAFLSKGEGCSGDTRDSLTREGFYKECADDDSEPCVLPKNLYVECNVEAALLEEVRAYAEPQLHGLDVHHSLPSEPDGDKILARVMQWLVQHARLQPQQ